jgi:DNA helicase HerA-like ATPase
LVSHDVLAVVTALIARLILELAQRLEPRAELPVLVLLEEAHRYVRRDPTGTRSQAAVIFERIAKEGRKYGVSHGIATQRPSELDPTVLSQCGTLIAHRTVGQVDQDLIRSATPLASRDVLRQLPGLATQHAVVLGEAVPAPVTVRVRQVADPPDSHDPSFIDRWREADLVRDIAALNTAARDWEQGVRRRTRFRDVGVIEDSS